MMNRKGFLSGAAAVLLVVSVSAAAKESYPLTVAYDATVRGKAIHQGVYNVTWKSHSPEAAVTFTELKGGKVAAEVQGKIVKRPDKYKSNAVVFANHPDGSRTILEIRLAGTHQAIVFSETERGAMNVRPEAQTAAALVVPQPRAKALSSKIRFVGKARAVTPARNAILDQAVPPQGFQANFKLPVNLRPCPAVRGFR